MPCGCVPSGIMIAKACWCYDREAPVCIKHISTLFSATMEPRRRCKRMPHATIPPSIRAILQVPNGGQLEHSRIGVWRSPDQAILETQNRLFAVPRHPNSISINTSPIVILLQTRFSKSERLWLLFASSFSSVGTATATTAAAPPSVQLLKWGLRLFICRCVHTGVRRLLYHVRCSSERARSSLTERLHTGIAGA